MDRLAVERGGRGVASSRSARQATGPGLGVRLGVAVAPAGLYLAHLAYGANQTLAAQALTAVLALGLLVAMATPLRRGLAALDGLDLLIVVFAALIGVLLLSLTPYALGGEHPLWAWAGVRPGAGTASVSATVAEIVKLTGLACIFLIGALQGARRDRAQATLEAVVWGGGVYGVVSLAMFGARMQAIPERLSGGFVSANTAATVFGVLVVLSLALFLRAWRRTQGLGLNRALTQVAAPLGCLLLAAACLILTASRMGVVATAFSAAVLLVWELIEHKKGRAGVAVAALAALVAGGVLLLGTGDALLARVETVGVDADVRSAIFNAHWNAFLAAPVTGNGLGSFDVVNLQSLTEGNVDALWSIRAAHNVYLQWLEETGVVGAVLMFGLIAIILIQALRRTSATRGGRTFVHGLVAADLVVMIHGAADYGLQVPSAAAFWAFLLGLQFAWGVSRS